MFSPVFPAHMSQEKYNPNSTQNTDFILTFPFKTLTPLWKIPESQLIFQPWVSFQCYCTMASPFEFVFSFLFSSSTFIEMFLFISLHIVEDFFQLLACLVILIFNLPNAEMYQCLCASSFKIPSACFIIFFNNKTKPLQPNKQKTLIFWCFYLSKLQFSQQPAKSLLWILIINIIFFFLSSLGLSFDSWSLNIQHPLNASLLLFPVPASDPPRLISVMYLLTPVCWVWHPLSLCSHFCYFSHCIFLGKTLIVFH